MVFFSCLRLLISLPFLSVLTGSGVGIPHQFLFRIIHYRPLYLHIRIPLPLPHNLSPHHALPYLPLPLSCHIFPPYVPLSLSILIPLTGNMYPPRAHFSLSIAIPHHLRPPCAPLYLSIPIHIPHPPYLSQRLPRCHSCTKMSQIIKCV